MNATELRQDLDTILESGIAVDPLDHSKQIAVVAAILHRAFANSGLVSTLIGGSAIEVYAPGIFASGDIDLIVEPVRSAGDATVRDRTGAVLTELGFQELGRHWTKRDLFVEVPSHRLDDPAETMHAGPFVFRVIAKEALLAYRLVGFKHWRHTGYGQQAIDMIAAFGDELNLGWLNERLKQEDVSDAFEAMRRLAFSGNPVTEEVLQGLLLELWAGG